MISTQWRASGFGLIGLDYLAVFKVAELMGMEMTEDVLKKLCLLENEVLVQQSKDIDKENRKTKS